MAILSSAPFLLLLLFWLWLALRRARQTDPRRARREARARLAATLALMREAPGSPQLILAWQRDAALLWEIDHAAPSAPVIGASPAAAGWAGLWAESERTLYGAGQAPAPDWIARAEAALAAKPAPKFKPHELFLPRNLFPFFALAVIVLAGLSLAADPGAGSARAAYRQGDFAAAEKGWRSAVGEEPANWAARHNLSLALAQQNRWDEAEAQAAAAFVQRPGDPAVRWQFALASDKAGFAPTTLAAFLNPDPIRSLARMASPAVWQLILAGAAGLAAVALGLLLAFSYRSDGPGAGWKIAAWSALVLAVLVGFAAWVGWFSYGAAADGRAVIVWQNGLLRSIPTEADTTQKTVPLAAGTLALVDKPFLGWVRLSFDNGQTGWVRKEDVIGLWGN